MVLWSGRFRTNNETVTPVDGIDYTEVPTGLGVRLETAFSGWLIKGTDCGVISEMRCYLLGALRQCSSMAPLLSLEWVIAKRTSDTSPEEMGLSRPSDGKTTMR